MQIQLVAFGITRDILGGREVAFTWEGPQTVAGLLEALGQQHPSLKGLSSLKVAINEEYATLESIIKPTDEVVLIPPVSGG